MFYNRSLREIKLRLQEMKYSIDELHCKFIQRPLKCECKSEVCVSKNYIQEHELVCFLECLNASISEFQHEFENGMKKIDKCQEMIEKLVPEKVNVKRLYKKKKPKEEAA